MENFKKAIKTLEFDKVLDMLCDCASLEGAKEKIMQSVPETDIAIVKQLQKQTICRLESM